MDKENARNRFPSIPPPLRRGFIHKRKFTIGNVYDDDRAVEFTMPAGTTVCDIGNFTLCYPSAGVFFIKLEIPWALFVRNSCASVLLIFIIIIIIYENSKKNTKTLYKECPKNL